MFAIVDTGTRAFISRNPVRNVVAWIPKTKRSVVVDLETTLARMNDYWSMVPESREVRRAALMNVARVWITTIGTPAYHGIMVYISGNDPLCLSGDDGDYPEFVSRDIQYCLMSGMAGRIASLELYARTGGTSPAVPPGMERPSSDAVCA